MPDPLARLGDLGGGIEPPDPATIRSRAHTYVRRRRVAVAASTGAALAAVVVIAAVVLPSGRGDRQVATDLGAGSPPLPTAVAPPAGEGDATTDSYAAGTEDGQAPAEARGEPGSAALTSGSADTAASKADGQPALSMSVVVSDEGATGHRFTLRVCNTSSDAATRRSFATSQRFDFEVYAGEANGGDDPVWRWADGRFFAQVTGSETWRPEECRDDWTATWDGRDSDGDPVGPGSYEVVGVLSASEPQRSEPSEVCRIACN